MATLTCDFSAFDSMSLDELDALARQTFFLDPEAIGATHPANIRMSAFPSYSVLYIPDDATDDTYSQCWLTHDDPNAHLLHTIQNFQTHFVQGNIPFNVYIHADTKDVRIALAKETARPLLVYRGYEERIGVLSKCGDEVALPYVAKSIPPTVMPSNVFVPEDVVVMHIRAVLFRKPPTKVTDNYVVPKPFETEESLVLPAGTYKSIEEIAEALNGAIKMRGERNGPVYFFMKSKKKRGVLRIAAHHRQPEPSFIVMSPCDAGPLLGLEGPAKLVLGNKKYVDFHGLPCGLIV